jgi:SnoaL-like domain
VTGGDARIQWLVDRAQIHDLLVAYARCADTKDWAGFAELFADEGTLVLPFGTVPKERLAESAERILGPFEATHHVFTNVSITIDGDTARTNHYLQATHVPSAVRPDQHADIGGWYDNTCRRTPEGWRFVTVDLTFVWSDGIPFEPGDPASPSRTAVGAGG